MRGMEYIHQCGFCDWQRGADSPTLVAPRCPDCGCVLSAHPRSDDDRRAATARVVWTHDLVRLGTTGAKLAMVLVVLAAARAGYVMGGPMIALVALGATMLGAIPVLFPERSPRRS